MKLPNGPKTPLWLETIQWILHPIEFFEARHSRYGDAFTLGAKSNSPIVYLSHPEAIKEVFTADPDLFDSGEATKAFAEPVLGKHSLTVLDGEVHQRQRRLLAPPLHGERMRTYGQLICEITKQVINNLPINQPFLVRSLMQDITLGVILQAVFGLEQGQNFEQLKQLLSSFLDSISSPLNASMLYFPALRRDLGSWSPWGKFIRLREKIDRILYSEIQQRRQQNNFSRTDILTLLLTAQDERGNLMTDAELRDELITLLVAGHETTASALTWSMYWIYYLPAVHRQLESELSTQSIDIEPSAIAKLPYLTAICQETLRIYPVIMATEPRVLKTSWKMMDYQFAPGTVLMPCIYLTHQREDLYPEPKQFKPERFLERQFSPYEYLPFGGSNRSCIGMAFAQFEMKLVIATILSNWELSLTNPDLVKAERRGATLAPSGNMQMIVLGQRQQQKIFAEVS